MAVSRWIGITVGAAATVALAGCGTSPQAGNTASSSSQSSSAAAPSTQTTQATQASSTTSATPSPAAPSGSASESSGDSGSKPSKSETVDGLTTFYENNQHLPNSKAQKFATCMVAQMYDKASPATITAMKNGDPSQIDKADSNLLAQSALKCQSALQ